MHAVLNRKWNMEAQVIFLNPFTVCSSCKREFVVFPFVDKETNRTKRTFARSPSMKKPTCNKVKVELGSKGT